jgi:hypothetical protein
MSLLINYQVIIIMNYLTFECIQMTNYWWNLYYYLYKMMFNESFFKTNNKCHSQKQIPWALRFLHSFRFFGAKFIKPTLFVIIMYLKNLSLLAFENNSHVPKFNHICFLIFWIRFWVKAWLGHQKRLFHCISNGPLHSKMSLKLNGTFILNYY